MMTLDTKPTSQQLLNPSFWDGLPPEGVQFESSKYIPCYAVLRNGEPIKYVCDNGKDIINSFPHDMAIKEAQSLANDNDNISLEISGYIERFR